MHKEKVDRSYLNCVVNYLYLLFFGLFFFSSLAQASLIDAKFKLTRQLSAFRSTKSTNEIATLYKDFLSKSMYSRCRWFPSDSQYLAIVSQKCGRLRGTLLAFSRFMTEHDANNISEGIVNDEGHLRFLSFGQSCDLF